MKIGTEPRLSCDLRRLRRGALRALIVACPLVPLAGAVLAADFGITVMDRSATTTQLSRTPSNAMILHNRDGFDGKVEIEVNIDPPVSGLEVQPSGGQDGLFEPDNQVIDLNSFAATRVPPGEYRVTVVVKGEKDGQPVTREASYTLTVAAPPQFDLKLAPPRLVIKQGASASTNVLTTFNQVDEALVNLQARLAGRAIDAGITPLFSGGGWQQNRINGGGSVPEWVVTRDPAIDSGTNTESTQLLVSVSKDTPPGEYTLRVVGIFNPEYVGWDHIPDQRTKKHAVPLHVTVVADPEYAHLQDPPNFEIWPAEKVVVIPAGGSGYLGRWVEIVAWGDRWDSTIRMQARMREPSGGIRVGVLGGPRLDLPTNNMAYGKNISIVVPEDTPPGSYFVEVTGTSKSRSGAELTKVATVEVVVPERPRTGGDSNNAESIGSIPGGEPIDAGYPDVEGVVDKAVAKACEMLSEAADTIACSVHTIKKPNFGQPTTSPDVSVGSSTPVTEKAGGGFDTEVFIRNPDDNNLRKGCGDLTPEMLTSLTSIDWVSLADNTVQLPDARQFVAIACNAAAGGSGPARGIIRRQRDQVMVDTSTRRKYDYKRKEDRNHVRMDSSNQHLVVREFVNDAMHDAPRSMTCAPKPANEAFEHGDVKLDKVPENARKFVTGAANAVNGELQNIERLDGALDAIDSTDSLLKNLGSQSIDLKRFNAATKFGRNLADLSVKSASGEKITTADLKNVTDTVADLTGNKHVKTVSENFDVLLTLETKDVKELADKLNTLRGERFKSLGQVLDGISKNAERITKAEDMIKRMEKVSNFLDKAAAGQQDPVKAFEAFGDYLEMIGLVAEKVPGMGEFMSKYAEAVKSMQGNVKTIAEAVRKRNEAINDRSAIEGYDYEKLQLDAETFEEDYATGGSGRKLSADYINVQRNTADELARAENAQRFWKDTQRCVIREAARMKALKQNSDSMQEEYKKLPDQRKLDRELSHAEAYAQYKRANGNSTERLNSKQAKLMGFESLKEAEAVITNTANTTRGALDRLDEAKAVAGRRDMIKQHLKENRQAWEEARKKRDDCVNRLETVEQEYWQALRGYVAKYSWLSVYLNPDKTKTSLAHKQKAQREALAILDRQIVQQGFEIREGRVEVILVDGCNERRTTVAVGG